MENIIGISLGSQSTVIGTLKGNAVHVILSDTSLRKIPTVVSYNDKHRSFGDISLTTYKSNYQRTIVYPSRWLGMQPNSPFITEEAKYATVPPVLTQDNLHIGFKINYKDNEEIYTAESLMALYFTKLKQNWAKEGIETNSVIVSIPDYATVYERKALIESIQIAELNCSSLINESSAIALDYGLLRKNELDKETQRIVGFVDMGQSKTTIFFGSFTQDLIKVLSVTAERFCGAREFDYLIAERLSKVFYDKYQCDPMQNTKCKIRLLEAIAKARKILTVNKDTTISIDSLMEGEDLVYTLTRVEFESIVQPVINKFKDICSIALQKALKEMNGVFITDIHSIEMAGEAVRTPIIQSVIREVFGIEVSKTLLPDECISRGCSLFGALNSPYYKVKEFTFEHYNPYTIVLEYPFVKSGQLQQRTNQIMKKGENIPGKKRIKFNKEQTQQNQDLVFKFSYLGNEVNWMKDLHLQEYIIQLPPISNLEDKWTFSFTFELDLNCFPMLSNAEVIEPNTNTGDINNNGNDGSNGNGNMPQEKSTLCNVYLNNIYYGSKDSMLDYMIKREKRQENEDIIIHIASDKKNQIEQFIYNTREKLINDLIPFVTSDEITVLTKQMDHLLTWLYSNDIDLYNKEVLDMKSNDMMQLGNSIYSRYKNWIELEESTNVIQKAIDKETALINENKAKQWYLKEDIDLIEATISSFNYYLNNILKELSIGIKTKEPKILPITVSKAIAGFNNDIRQIYIIGENKVFELERQKEEQQSQGKAKR